MSIPIPSAAKSMREVTEEINREATARRALEAKAKLEHEARLKIDPNYMNAPSKINFVFTPGYGSNK
jgi:hypothetical protein